MFAARFCEKRLDAPRRLPPPLCGCLMRAVSEGQTWIPVKMSATSVLNRNSVTRPMSRDACYLPRA